jgi:membrane-associated phospholipid phosphatase
MVSKEDQRMRHREPHLAIVVSMVAWLLTITCGEASAQRSRLLEFGPDAVELQPWSGAGKGLRSLPAPIEAGAGSWRPWVLASGRDLRLPPPPDDRSTAAELRELRKLGAGDDAAALERIRFWDFWSPAHRWNEMLTDMGVRDNIGSAEGIHAFALLNVAIHDAMIAAWDSKYTYNRKRPGELGRLATEVAVPRSPSYPCEHAVGAGAAAAVLAHLFPADAQHLVAAAHEAAWSRVLAGAVYPSDARAGLELGRAVAARVIEYARTDGTGWASPLPAGPGLWRGPQSLGSDEMRWNPFVLTSASQVRLGPPPAPESPARAAEVAELKNYERILLANSRSSYSEFVQHRQAELHYRLSDEIGRRLAEAGLDGNAPRAARAYALVHVARYDALVASQDARFHDRTAGPDQFDPTIATLIPTPPFPSHPSGAAAIGMAPALVLGHLFPREAPRYMRWAQEYGESPVSAGIHFRSDVEAGWEIGRRVGATLIERARRDGAE